MRRMLAVLCAFVVVAFPRPESATAASRLRGTPTLTGVSKLPIGGLQHATDSCELIDIPDARARLPRLSGTVHLIARTTSCARTLGLRWERETQLRRGV